MAINWLDLELRHLQTFRVLAQRLSFRATAAELGFAPSAISQHIATLERRVGERLVDRGQGARAVQLTAVGEELLLTHVDAILGRVAIAERDFAERSSSHRWVTRIGSFQTVSATFLPAALAAIRSHDSGFAFELVHTSEPIRLLRTGFLDVAFCETAPEEANLDYVNVLEDPYVVVVPADTPLEDREQPMSLERLTKARVLTFETSCHLSELERELASAGTRLQPAARNDDVPTLIRLVMDGFGVALLPRLAIHGSALRLPVLEVDGRVRPRRLCLAWNRERQPSHRMRTLIDTVCDAAAAFVSAT